MKLKIEKYEQSSNSEQEEEDEEFDNTNMTDGEFLGQQQPLLPSSSLAEAFGVESDKNEQAITADEQGIADESNGKKRNEFFFGEYPVQGEQPLFVCDCKIEIFILLELIIRLTSIE